MTHALYIGIDVSKESLEVASTQKLMGEYPNSEAGIRRLAKALGKLATPQVIIEATGVYSSLVANLLAEQWDVFVVQPGRVRHFARSQGLLAKTDALDARIIAAYGEASRGLRPHAPPTVHQQHFRALGDRRDQLVEDRKREKCRLEACRDHRIIRQIKGHIQRLTSDIKKLEQAIKAAIKADEQLRTKEAVLTSHHGVALVTASCLLAHMPELGTVNRQEVAALAGMAPFNRDSGEMAGKRRIYGGRKRVRDAMYMATITAVRKQGQLRDSYLRLIQRGKPKKVALIACARKLLVELNSAIAQHLKPVEGPVIAP